MYDHPTTLKIIQIAGAVLGIGLIAFSLHAPLILSAAITYGAAVVGGIVLLSVIASLLFVKYISGPARDFEVHVFQESQCEGGRLYYRGNIPILELDGIDPHQTGYAHGLLLGSHIHELVTHNLAVRIVLQQFQTPELPNLLAQLREKIPQQYLEEMEGLHEGYTEWAYNQWGDEATTAAPLTLDDILLIQLSADKEHFHPDQMNEATNPIETAIVSTGTLGCTSILHQDEEKNVNFGYACRIIQPPSVRTFTNGRSCNAIDRP